MTPCIAILALASSTRNLSCSLDKHGKWQKSEQMIFWKRWKLQLGADQGNRLQSLNWNAYLVINSLGRKYTKDQLNKPNWFCRFCDGLQKHGYNACHPWKSLQNAFWLFAAAQTNCSCAMQRLGGQHWNKPSATIKDCFRHCIQTRYVQNTTIGFTWASNMKTQDANIVLGRRSSAPILQEILRRQFRSSPAAWNRRHVQSTYHAAFAATIHGNVQWNALPNEWVQVAISIRWSCCRIRYGNQRCFHQCQMPDPRHGNKREWCVAMGKRTGPRRHRSFLPRA